MDLFKDMTGGMMKVDLDSVDVVAWDIKKNKNFNCIAYVTYEEAHLQNYTNILLNKSTKNLNTNLKRH